MTAPRIITRSFYHASADRIEVYIAHQFQKIAIAIHKNRFVTTLEQVPGSFGLPVNPAGVTKREILHASLQRKIAALQGKMDMVGHEAKGVNSVTEADSSFLKQEIETESILVAKKYGLSTITAKYDVVESAGQVYARFSCHSDCLHQNDNLVNLEA